MILPRERRRGRYGAALADAVFTPSWPALGRGDDPRGSPGGRVWHEASRGEGGGVEASAVGHARIAVGATPAVRDRVEKACGGLVGLPSSCTTRALVGEGPDVVGPRGISGGRVVAQCL